MSTTPFSTSSTITGSKIVANTITAGKLTLGFPTPHLALTVFNRNQAMFTFHNLSPDEVIGFLDSHEAEWYYQFPLDSIEYRFQNIHAYGKDLGILAKLRYGGE